MRFAICEDNQSDRDRLSTLLSEYLAANRMDAHIDMFKSGEALLKAFSPGAYQVIFQDIYMDKDGITGMQTAERVRETDEEVSIIFTTTSTEHGHLSYSVDAAYYLVKPVERQGLDKALTKCREQLARYAKTIEITTNRQNETIRLRDIYFAEVFLHNTLLHTVTGEKKTTLAFSELVELLGGFPFVLCHRSFAVNLVHVAGIKEKDFIMKNGGKVPISKTFEEQARIAFKSYFWGSDSGDPFQKTADKSVVQS